MRSYKILYYTKNKSKFASFKAAHAQELADAQYQGTPVVFLDAFKGVIPLFKDTISLAQYLGDYSDYLSDVIVIVDTEQLKDETGGAKNLRRIIIEYPEVKFLFDANPKWVLFNKDEILDDIHTASHEECEACLAILNSSTHHQIVKQSFLLKLSNQSIDPKLEGVSLISKLFSKAIGILSLNNNKGCDIQDRAWTLLRKVVDCDPSYVKDDIRDVRKAFIRKIALDYIIFDLITIPETKNNSNLILSIVEGYDNLFDASNLRYAIKQWKYADLDVHAQNFRSSQQSRRDYLALCVEEERGQNRFNSYCLFTNGYRVLPVVCAKELMRINSNNILGLSPAIIVRDYDIQFPDQHTVPKNCGTEPIDQIRGFRYHDDSRSWTTHFEESKCWSNFYHKTAQGQKYQTHIPVLFISKGGRKIRITSSSFLFPELRKSSSQYKGFSILKFFGKPILFLSGLTKPISGIHLPFFDIKPIRQRFYDSRHHKRNYLNTSRQGHEHGTSLDIYSMVKSILGRARKYYELGKYIHAAVLANEAIEYLNGFHQALMIEAYYINAISENAIALDAMGVDEESLSEDAGLRVRKIQKDINRIYAQKGLSKKGISELSKNALNQIFSDCRTFCRNKEHFKAEEVFISAIGHLNEKLSIF